MEGRGLFYNTAPLGLGHLIPTIHLSKCLIEHFEIDYFLGSPAVFPFPVSPHFHLHQLPPITVDSKSHQLVDPNGNLSIKEVFKKRTEKINEVLTQKYDFFICEHFPFGRHPFYSEIINMIDIVKRINPSCLITSSFRGEKAISAEALPKVDEILRCYFDYIFIHEDSRMTRSNHILEIFSEYRNKFIFTGFITDPDFQSKNVQRKKQIVVSIGAGSFGEELILAALEISSSIPDYEFIFMVPENIKNKLPPNVSMIPLTNQFVQILSESALSISLAGSGTISDIMLTKTPAIIYPHSQPKDQEENATLCEKSGIAIKISLSDLSDPIRLRQIIVAALGKKWTPSELNIQGAQTTTQKLRELIKHM